MTTKFELDLYLITLNPSVNFNEIDASLKVIDQKSVTMMIHDPNVSTRLCKQHNDTGAKMLDFVYHMTLKLL